jgi:integrase
MLHLCFCAGLRVTELVTSPLTAVTWQSTPSIHIAGKGRRHRVLPLWKQTAEDLQAWLAVRGEVSTPAIFVNAQGRTMTRVGFTYVLTKHVQRATHNCPSLVGKTVSPHVLRHYLPFLTMSGNLSAATDVAGFHRLQGFERLTVTRHSFLVPTDRCSGGSPGENHPYLQQNHLIVDSALYGGLLRRLSGCWKESKTISISSNRYAGKSRFSKWYKT